jgi:hypothetical protein
LKTALTETIFIRRHYGKTENTMSANKTHKTKLDETFI